MPTTAKVTTPPTATQGMAPMAAATIPLSKAPNSLEEQTNTQLTAEIRPRISSGDKSLTIERRMIMLTPSNTPLRAKAANDSRKFLENPNIRMLKPKPATVKSKLRPALAMGGCLVA